MPIAYSFRFQSQIGVAYALEAELDASAMRSRLASETHSEFHAPSSLGRDRLPSKADDERTEFTAVTFVVQEVGTTSIESKCVLRCLFTHRRHSAPDLSMTDIRPSTVRRSIHATPLPYRVR